jgi:lipopolysaccharide biosynthesis glycosyltransferase
MNELLNTKYRSFCTIITPDYLPYALAMHESLCSNGNTSISLFVLVAALKDDSNLMDADLDGITILYIDDVCKDGIGKKIKGKYFLQNIDGFRWAMKPVLINYLLQVLDFEKVIFLDCDLYFFSDFSFFFKKLDENNILLTPHWRSSNPHVDKNNFALQYNSGLFNGGFIGVNKNATVAMDWWAKACEYICEINPSHGHYVDQTHLNLLPVFFDKVEILKHRGCNVANWNQHECKRILKADGSVRINDEYAIVFIHFTTSTIRGILNGEDPLLLSYLEKFSQSLNRYGWPYDVIEHFTALIQNNVDVKPKIIKRIKNKFNKWRSL